MFMSEIKRMTLEGKEIVFTRITWGELSSVQVIYLINYEIQRKRNYYMAKEPWRNHDSYGTLTPSYIEEYKTKGASMD